jgi:phosphoribosylpyrophosphate synthetase
VDDMIDTGHTLTLAARTLHEKGAKTIYVLISHGACLVECNDCQTPDDRSDPSRTLRRSPHGFFE